MQPTTYDACLIAKLHDPKSHLLEVVKKALATGKLVIVDLSLMRGQPATALSAILLRWLFEKNIEENTKVDGSHHKIYNDRLSHFS